MCQAWLWSWLLSHEADKLLPSRSWQARGERKTTNKQTEKTVKVLRVVGRALRTVRGLCTRKEQLLAGVSQQG